jgi:hypothetical protein
VASINTAIPNTVDSWTYQYGDLAIGMVIEVTEPNGGYAPLDKNDVAVASYKSIGGVGGVSLFVPAAQGSFVPVSAGNGATISFLFPDNPAEVARDINICGASKGFIVVFNDYKSDVPFMTIPLMSYPSACKLYKINVHDVTSISVTSDGFISDLGVCIQTDDNNDDILQFVPPYASPTVSMSPTMCPPSEAILVSQDGITNYPVNKPPLRIIAQNGTHVTFEVENTYEYAFTSFYIEYHTGAFGESDCLETQNVEALTEVAEYTAECMVNVPISIVNLWVVDCNQTFFSTEEDHAEIPICCGPPTDTQCPTVQYTFKLECVDPCPDDWTPPARQLSTMEQEEDAASVEAFKNAAKEGVSASEPSSDGKDGHFCVSEDYPCGEQLDRVYVCHYSARDGYKTFCVPEPDSDVLAFYPKDYCGPCVGGYGGEKIN